MQRLHFISGLPRSGSTLLSALLRQNPRFHAGMSGPLSGLVASLLNEMSAANEYAVFISDTQRQRILRGLLDQSYGEEYPQPVIFDTSRAWCSRMNLLEALAPSSKVIACVREVPWFAHSPAGLSFDASAFDAHAGAPGLHEVRPVVNVNRRATILPPDVYRRFENDAFWNNPALNLHRVPVL
jgi:hypothetical protein